MTIERALLAKSAQATAAAVYIEDVFSSWLRTGTGASSTVTNNIDIQTNGGLVITKSRSAATSWRFTDKSRGATYSLDSSSTASQATDANGLTAFTTSGYTVGSDTNYNNTGATYVDFAFRKQPKFFDVVTYTGNGVNNRQISHNLGSSPGMVIVKRTDVSDLWVVWHRSVSVAGGGNLFLHLTNALGGAKIYDADASTFTVINDTPVNANGGTYVAYLFAHNAGGFGPAGTDSVVACGSFTADGSRNAIVNLGWEPQYILWKRTNAADDWYVHDIMRGWSMTSYTYLSPNSSAADSTITTPYSIPTSTGFTFQNSGLGAGGTYIYLAIRRGPMKTPTDATKVFAPVGYTGNNTSQTINVGFPFDLIWHTTRNAANGTWNYDRLRNNQRLITSSSGAEAGAGLFNFDSQNSTSVAGNVSGYNLSGENYIGHYFRRAPGFFDVVCYTGTGSASQINHNLGVVPELVIWKARTSATIPGWNTYVSGYGTNGLLLNDTSSAGSNLAPIDSATSTTLTPSLAVFSQSGQNFVMYLFATCPGVSKVFSFTGNGSSQTIDCGFTSGARFVLIKRTDAAGSWWVFDSARGIVSAADPALQLNSTAAEVTSADAIDPASSGFIVNQEATCNVNVNNATYIGLAIA